MIFENKDKPSSDFNDHVTGIKDVYPCWRFKYKNIDDIEDYKNAICIYSYTAPNEEGNIIQRNYIKIGFYKDFEDFKNERLEGYVPTHFFVIPVKESLKNDILLDIRERNEFKVQ